MEHLPERDPNPPDPPHYDCDHADCIFCDHDICHIDEGEPAELHNYSICNDCMDKLKAM